MNEIDENTGYGELLARVDRKRLPGHVAIIMDGNGRWAKRKGLPRIAGHMEGIRSVRNIVTTAREIGIPLLTLYAFSVENWQRPPREVNTLMTLLVEYLKKEINTLMENEIRLRTIGRINDLPGKVRQWLEKTMEVTGKNDKMQLVLALSYSGRAEIVDAVKKIAADVKNGGQREDEIDETTVSRYLYTSDFPDPDILIRTSGETRISNFLLWQIAYTEFFFTKVLWPDFRRENFLRTLLEYQTRERRFGQVSEKTMPDAY